MPDSSPAPPRPGRNGSCGAAARAASKHGCALTSEMQDVLLSHLMSIVQARNQRLHLENTCNILEIQDVRCFCFPIAASPKCEQLAL